MARAAEKNLLHFQARWVHEDVDAFRKLPVNASVEYVFDQFEETLTEFLDPRSGQPTNRWAGLSQKENSTGLKHWAAYNVERNRGGAL